jgi:hypothetical protein
VAALTGLLVLVVAVTLLVMVGRDGSGTASPSAPPVAASSPSANVTVTPTASLSPSAAPTSEPSVTPSAAPSSCPSAAPAASPGAPALATLTFVGLKLDSTADPGGEARVVTFRSDGAGTISAKLGTSSPLGTTHMCLLVGTKQIGCKDMRSGTFTGKTSQAHASWTVTLRGAAADAPTVDLTVTFQAVAPKVAIAHARFDGTAAPDSNGIQARFSARAAGNVRLVADWGGHPFLYEIDLFDESAGSGNATLANQGPSTNVDQSLPVTAGNWRLVLQNIEAGFGTTDLTATISWP